MLPILHLGLLALASALVAFVAGFLLAFRLVVMPGLARLPDADFVRAFQVIDGIIQKGEPRFLAIWLGSALVLLIAAVLGLFVAPTLPATLAAVAAALYLIGLQLPTITKNIPLNNALQACDLEHATPGTAADARSVFERPWNRWNAFRTHVAISTSGLLLMTLAVL